MKNTKIIFVIPLAFIILFVHCEKEEGPDPNDPVNIPDKAFLNALLKEGIDTNGDSLISYAEAGAVNYLNVDGSPDSLGEIKNMTGLEAFRYLDTLHCCMNKIEDLDVSSNEELIALYCWGKHHVDESNGLSNLNVSNTINLKCISVPGNKLTMLDVSQNSSLERLWCTDNQLQHIDLSGNSNLYELFCGYNQLTSLDVSNNTSLRWFGCSGNQLTELDISKNINLGKSGTSGSGWDPAIGLSDMPALGQVCVWTMPFPPEGVTIDTINSPNVYFTNSCGK